jgi:FkbM family methyltransferase
MDVPSLVYQRMLDARGMSQRFWFYLRVLLIKLLKDPQCTLRVHGRLLHMPLSHALPRMLKDHVMYDSLPTRLSGFIRAKYGKLTCIDVGANIGDSVAAMYADGADGDRFLAVEPHATFQDYLRANWGGTAGVRIETCRCGAVSEVTAFRVVPNLQGSAAFVPDRASANVVPTRSIDDLVAEYPDLSTVNLIKSDTDGADFGVIAGGMRTIAAFRPAILFECYAGDETYVEDCMSMLASLRNAGYSGYLLYDNAGYVMGQHCLSDERAFRDLLFYQLTSPFPYFDVLVLNDDDLPSFAASELAMYAARVPDEFLRRASEAAIAARRIASTC